MKQEEQAAFEEKYVRSYNSRSDLTADMIFRNKLRLRDQMLMAQLIDKLEEIRREIRFNH